MLRTSSGEPSSISMTCVGGRSCRSTLSSAAARYCARCAGITTVMLGVLRCSAAMGLLQLPLMVHHYQAGPRRAAGAVVVGGGDGKTPGIFHHVHQSIGNAKLQPDAVGALHQGKTGNATDECLVA